LFFRGIKFQAMKAPATAEQPADASVSEAADSISGADPEFTVLNIGSGYPLRQMLPAAFQGPQWRELRHDIEAQAGPDIVCPMTDLSPVAAGSVDAVWSSHNLIHLYRHEVPRALAEFLRVLRPGGLLLVSVLDLRRVCEYIAAGALDDEVYRAPSGPITPLDMLFGHVDSIGQGAAYMAHRSGFTSTTLGHLLVAAGFVGVEVSQADFDLQAKAYKPG
jgi:predicted SAM-dependent methyltransferase